MATSPHSPHDVQMGLAYAEFELQQCCSLAVRFAKERRFNHDEIVVSAYLAASLVHARSLYEFLDAKRVRNKPDDMILGDFGGEWTLTPEGEEARSRLAGVQSFINKYVAHMTWTRVYERNPPSRSVLEIALDTAHLFHDWCAYISALGPGSNSPDFDHSLGVATFYVGMIEQQLDPDSQWDLIYSDEMWVNGVDGEGQTQRKSDFAGRIIQRHIPIGPLPAPVDWPGGTTWDRRRHHTWLRLRAL